MCDDGSRRLRPVPEKGVDCAEAIAPPVDLDDADMVRKVVAYRADENLCVVKDIVERSMASLPMSLGKATGELHYCFTGAASRPAASLVGDIE